MQNQSAVVKATDHHDAASKRVKIIFKDEKDPRIRQLLKCGAQVELKLTNCGPDDLNPFMDLRGRSAIVFDVSCFGFVTGVYTSINQNRRLSDPFSFTLTEEFEKWQTCKELFFKGIATKLEYLQIRPA